MAGISTYTILNLIFTPIKALGRNTIQVFSIVGNFTLFTIESIKRFKSRAFIRNFPQQFIDITFFSILLISVTGFFSGAVLALQSYNGLSRFGATSSVPAIVALSLTRELGPVLSALMLTSRTASRIAAEIGGMAITSQISAMTFLGVHPMGFILIPRIIATIVAMPILSFIFTLCGSIGGYIICTQLFHFDETEVIMNALDILKPLDIYSGLIKAATFGGILSLIACYCGYKVKGGATEVGRATTNAVVISSVLILLSNYILTSVMFRE